MNTLYEEVAKRIGAEGPNRTKKVCESIINDEIKLNVE